MSQNMKPETPFQLMPELPSWEFDALKESIRQHGVIVPIIRDEHGSIIDGHHRDRACRELRIKDAPTITLAGLTVDQKRDHALVLNLVRRKITRKQMRAIIGTELRRTPDMSNQWLAEIVGSTDKTVESVRRELIVGSEIPILDSYRAKDGKRYPATRLYTERAKQEERARTALAALGDDAPRKAVSLKQLEREAKKKERASLPRGRYRKPDEKAPVRLYHSDFRNLEEIAQIEPGSVDLVLTDVPYNRAFTKQFDDLGAFAARVLKDGGVFAAYFGVIQVADAIIEFSKHLQYQATAFSSWCGDGPVLQNVQCVTQSTPILVFSKGKWTRTTRWYNCFHNDGAEQELHEWQKPLADVEHWLLSFSDPGAVICDPCSGSGSTAAVCFQNERRFVGCDIDRDAVRLAQHRLRKMSAQPTGQPKLSVGKPMKKLSKAK
ncbi:DNA methyltransferase [Rhodopirellula sp. SWK7]|uniref:DNA methyltransferase n=1 Tax=Rhodopirellula sp. SWK7 TaxID=595460 RepID=UPI0002BEAEAC|nr:DNA methyltransferase [Rhodopirellula sp. SWK7]EMI41641.1 DNA methylase N-4/N-6 [Rhodopirellula sp. SWK7]